MSSMKNTGPNTVSLVAKGHIELDVIQVEAIEWQERMCGATNEKTEHEFDDWMAISDVHRQAYLEAELLADGFDRLAAQPSMIEHLTTSYNDDDQSSFNVMSIRTQSKSAKRILSSLALAACLAVVTIVNLTWFSDQIEPRQTVTVKTFQSQYHSDTGELRTIALPDGSTLTLGPNSLVNVRFGEFSRKVELVLGEAYFDVAKSQGRPFFVEAEQASVKVLGTRFDVRRLSETTSVSVVEGVVQVFNGKESARLSSPDSAPTTLLAGQYVMSDGEADIVVLEGQELVTWINGRLVYSNAELRDVLADANRYSKYVPIRLSDLSLGEQKVTLSVNVDSIDDLPLMLSELMDLDISQNAVETVLSSK